MLILILIIIGLALLGFSEHYLRKHLDWVKTWGFPEEPAHGYINYPIALVLTLVATVLEVTAFALMIARFV
jgi:hypothetical protein